VTTDRSAILAVMLAAALVPPAAAGGQRPAFQAPASTADQQPPAAGQPPDRPVDLLWRTQAEDDGSGEGRILSLAALSLGADQDGSATYSGRGSFFVRFAGASAFQVDGTYDWFDGRREGQLDFALVHRLRQVQLGVFASTRYVNLKVYETGGSLSQFGVTFDYVLPRGRIGVFGTGGLQDIDRLGRRRVKGNVFEEPYLSRVGQFGGSGEVDISDRARVEGRLSVLDPVGQGRTTGGSVRAIYAVTDGWALTAEGAWNPSLVTNGTQGRFLVGAQMGRWRLPRRQEQPPDRPVPIDMPALRYETLVERIRDGNDAPFADAGSDLTIEPVCASPEVPCTVAVTVTGVASDPDGDTLTYLWTTRSGFTDEQLTSTDTLSTGFTGRAGRSYVLRLRVTDDREAFAVDEVTVTILKPRRPSATSP